LQAPASKFQPKGSLIVSSATLAPDLADPAKIIRTSRGLTMALGGFANTALALVASPLFLSAAMT
jgi:hypothetical protein